MSKKTATARNTFYPPATDTQGIGGWSTVDISPRKGGESASIERVGHMRADGVTVNGTDMVCEGGQTAENIPEIGRVTRKMGKGDRDMVLVLSMTGTGKTTKDLGMEDLYIWTEENTWGNGKTIAVMGMGPI